MIVNPFRLFDSYPQLRVAMFTKSQSPLRGTGDEIEQQAGQRLGAPRSAGAAQIHGNKTAVASGDEKDFPDADALATAEQGLCLVTRWADCQNFIVYAPEQNVIGVIHAGWRGLMKGVIPEHFRLLQARWGINPQDVLVGACPSLCQDCAEFTDPVRELAGIDSRFFAGRNVDLRGIAQDQLRKVGVVMNHFERHADCTRCNPEQYWSYRANPAEVKNGGKNLTAVVLQAR